MSGSYFNRFLENRYMATYEETSRKIFRDEEQSRDYFRDHDRAAKAGFLAARADYDAFLAWGDERGIAVGEFDPFLPSFPIAAAEQLGALDPEAFPLNVSLSARTTPRAIQHIDLTLLRPVPAPRAAEWLSRAAALSFQEKSPGAAADLTEPFVIPTAALGAGRFFGFHLGTTAEARTAVADSYQRRFRARWSEIFPRLEERMGDARGVTARAGFKHPRPLAERLGGPLTAGVFNPHGPLLDEFWRDRLDRGQVTAIVLFTPAQALPEEQPPLEFGRWLSSLMDTPHDAAVRREMDFFAARFGEVSERCGALDRLRNDPSDRRVRLLAALLNDPSPKESPSLLEKAAEHLAALDAPARREVFLRRALAQEPSFLLPRTAEALAHYPDRPVIDALTALWNNTRLEWNSRYPARDALRSMMANWPDAAERKEILARLID